MANTDTSLKAVGPAAAQLKQKHSALEKTQISALRNVGGSVSLRPGVVNGDVSKKMTNINATQRSAMELGADISAKMEVAGAFSKTAEQVIRPSVVSTALDKKRLEDRYPSTDKDLGIAKNRNPTTFRKSPSEKIKERKEELVGFEDFNYAGLSFPNDLQTQASTFVQLEFHKYDRSSPFAEGSIAPTINIFLPLPENFAIGYNIKYDERDTGILGEVMKSKAGRDAVKGYSTGGIGGAMSAIEQNVAGATSEDTAQAISEVASRAAFAALNSASETVGGLAGRLAGEIPNPHPTVFFKGLDLRQFTWTWKFVPRNEAEANNLKVILFLIRKFILPTNTGGFLQYPQMIKPKVKDKSGQDILLYGSFKRSVVKEFLVNYTGEGTSAFFHDGTPVAMNVQMTFQEVEMYTASDA